MGNRLERALRADPDAVRHAVRVSVWGRWFGLLVVAFQSAYGSGLWFPDDIEHLYLHGTLMVFNGLVHYWLLTNRPVTRRWLLALSTIDASAGCGPRRSPELRF